MKLEIPTHLITNIQIRTAVEKCIEYYSSEDVDLLYKTPSSFSKKYHPVDERGDDGVVRHVIRLFRVLQEVSKHFAVSQTNRDVLYAAAFFHDIGKVAKQSSIGHEPVSATIADRYLTEAGLDDGVLINGALKNRIVNIVKCHTASWNKKAAQPATKLEIIFSMADFVVAQDWILTDIKGYIP